MDYIYEDMDRAKEATAKSLHHKEDKYSEVFKIIDTRWNCQLHQPLHAAGHYLKLEYYYDNRQIEQDEEVKDGLYKCIARLVPDLGDQDKIGEELSKYQNAEGLFGIPMAIRHRKTKAPDKNS